MSWTFYSAFLGTVISIIALTRLAYREHDREQPRTLSELAAAEDHLLRRFRKILWLWGTLFAVTCYWFIVPRTNHALLVVLAWSLTYAGEMLLALIPARDKTTWIHDILAKAMGIGMLALAYIFWRGLHDTYASIELYIAVTMSLLGILTVADKCRFIFYELLFIYLSHFSIVIGALALR